MLIRIPEKFLSSLGPEMKMDVHWVDVKLKDKRVVKKLVVRGGAYITGRATDENGKGELPFNADDILKLRRHSWLPFF